jgi:hypothetical protein
MPNYITSSLAINKARNFFNDKKAKTKSVLNNLAGDEIPEGSEVIITGRGNSKVSFDIQDVNTGVVIRNIWCELLELV